LSAFGVINGSQSQATSWNSLASYDNVMSSTSDRRLKNTIQCFNDKYEILFDNLKPVSYKYNNGTSGRTHTGFVA
jgi:hypothetical protein